MTRFVKRGGKVWIRLFPDKPITKKPAETRMGKGKGAPEHWVAVVRPGKILFEMEGVTDHGGQGGDAAGGAQAADADEVRKARSAVANSEKSDCRSKAEGELFLRPDTLDLRPDL